MDFKRLENFLKESGQQKFRFGQIKKAIFQDGISSFSEITTIPKNLRGELGVMDILSFRVVKVLAAKDGQSIKALLELPDKNLIETVLISPKPGIWSACISCQVGCPNRCKFCATGKMGLKRNLTAEEITDQVLFWVRYLAGTFIPSENFSLPTGQAGQRDKRKLNNIVYMGMGEPFLNWKEVSESLKILTDPELFGFGSRSISVSTSGIPEGIEKLAEEFPQINLALSLHFGNNDKRGEFMPVNIAYDLEKLKAAIRRYFAKTNRKIFIEYILLDGINDGAENARDLIAYLKSIGKTHLLHVNLIRYNETSGGLKASSKNKTQEFKNFLQKNRISATIRKSLGEEIQGACGQLAGK